MTIELQRLALKSMLSNGECFSFEQRAYLYKCMQRYYFKFSVSYFRNSCLVTRHSKSVFRMFKMSRHFSKKLSSNGLVMGMRKSSF